MQPVTGYGIDRGSQRAATTDRSTRRFSAYSAIGRYETIVRSFEVVELESGKYVDILLEAQKLKMSKECGGTTQ